MVPLLRSIGRSPAFSFLRHTPVAPSLCADRCKLTTMAKTFYMTTPLYYVNAPPSWGAYTTIVADTICRYKKMMGFDVFLLTGTDEHGQNIERAAQKQGIQPKELADRVYAQYLDLWKRLGIE